MLLSDRAIHILGVGNLGKYVAHALATHYPRLPVTLIFRKKDSYDKFVDGGRKITKWIDEHTQDSKSGFRAEWIGQSRPGSPHISNLIVATKGQQTLTPVGFLSPRLDRNSTVLLLQNGMGVKEELDSQILAFRSPEHRPSYWAGVCSTGVFGRGDPSRPVCPFTFQVAGSGPLNIGPFSESQEIEKQHPLRRALEKCHPTLRTEFLDYEKIKLARLRKLVMNAVINPLTAVHRCPNGWLRSLERFKALPDHPVTGITAEYRPSSLVAEIGPIVRAVLDLPSGNPKLDEAWSDLALLREALLLADRTGENRSSMLQDVEGGRETEIDYICGWLIKKARELGLKCPRGTQNLYHHIKFRKWENGEELRRLGPSPRGAASVEDMKAMDKSIGDRDMVTVEKPEWLKAKVTVETPEWLKPKAVNKGDKPWGKAPKRANKYMSKAQGPGKGKR
ncbi:2-dehydropantoate 2-reductase (Ketopantoate reductase) (KPA reductase) (KPR) [Podospora pseudopauciseta]|uniref:2-dehydropantoate 2-reductase n=1 Tax=Podospora pseudopauciseta TaxID=2093780 RepID=A0ABR0HBS7_9PEZI|nr:2-dehydropantoate 2-reductase (Ketopantoate reductase) (KPA reductase) (KPR) [Podospora pseudopauciseta]